MWEIAGHDRVVGELQASIAAGALPHALLLVGQAGIGKTTLAIELARTLNCVGANPPCGQCIHCRQISRGSHPDVSLIERPDGKDSIAIGQVRALRDDASLRPYQGKRKIFIIVGAEGLTAQAADALLKTLEEPPPQVTIVLTTSDAESLPSTILSRCRVVTLRPLPDEAIRALIAEEVEPDTARRIASLAAGSPGWARAAARQPKLLEERGDTLNRLVQVPDLDMAERLRLAEALATEKKDRTQVRRSLEMLLLLARDLMLVRAGLETRTVDGNARQTLYAQAARFSDEDLNRYIRRIRQAMDRIDANVDSRLALEAMLVSAP